MAILFDWYENPKTKDKQGEELTLHPRIKLNGSTTTDELRRHIQEYCSLTETDVLAVLDALSHASWGRAGRYIWTASVTLFPR